MKSASCLFFLVLILALWPRRILSHGGQDKNPHAECPPCHCGQDKNPHVESHGGQNKNPHVESHGGHNKKNPHVQSHGRQINKNPHLDMVTEACASTPCKDLCMSTIKAYGGTGGAPDLQSAAKISVKVAWAVASETQVTINKMLNTTSVTSSVPFVNKCLKDCDATYDNAVANLQKAFEAFDMKAYGEIVTCVATAMGAPTTCEGYFKAAVGYTCPVAGMNIAMLKLCSTALTLTKLCAAGHN